MTFHTDPALWSDDDLRNEIIAMENKDRLGPHGLETLRRLQSEKARRAAAKRAEAGT